MKKLAALVIIIAALVASPFFIGNFTKGRVNSHIEEFNRLEGGTAELINYEKGYMGAKAQVRLRINHEELQEILSELPDSLMLNQVLEKEGAIIDLDIHHGPVITGPSFSIGLSKVVFSLNKKHETLNKMITELNERIGLEKVFNVELTTTLLGTESLVAEILPIQYKDTSFTVDFGGMELAIKETGKNQYEINGKSKTLKISEGIKEILVSPINIFAEGEVNEDLTNGEGEFKLKISKISYKDSSETGELKNFVIASYTKKADGSDDSMAIYNMGYEIGVDKINTSSMPSGLEDFNIKFALNNIRTKALAEYSKTINKKTSDVRKVSSMTDQIAQTELLKILSGIELILENLSISYGKDHSLKLSGKISLAENAVDLSAQLKNFKELSSLISGEISVDLSEGFIEEIASAAGELKKSKQTKGPKKTPEQLKMEAEQEKMMMAAMIETYLGMGFMVKDDEGYHTLITYTNGELLVNGKSMQLPE